MILTLEMINSFLDSLQERVQTPETVKRYRRDLLRFYDFLPPDKRLTSGVISSWQKSQLEEGYSPKSVNISTSAINSLFEYLGYWQLKASQIPLPENTIQPELTRTEYLRLLQTAKILNKEHAYLLTKVFGSLGIPLQELPKLTIEVITAGCFSIKDGNEFRTIHIPDCLKRELLSYAKKKYISSGPVFVSKNGTVMHRSTITCCINHLCRDAKVPEEKGNPRCLIKLYKKTMDDIYFNMTLLVEQTYDRLMEKEQSIIGWEQDNGN